MSDERPRVAIIGAGPSGLAAAHHLAESHRVSLFDTREDVGGVWAQSSAQVYPWLETNTPTALFPFPGFPMIASDWNVISRKNHSYPYVDGRTAQRYYARFARENCLDRVGRLESVQLQTRVLKLQKAQQPSEGNGWLVTYIDSLTNLTSTMRYDRVIIATGAFSTPSVPDSLQFAISNSTFAFHSSSMGSSQFENRLSFAKKIIILGGGKSALDLIARVKTANGPSVVWILPPRNSPSAWPLLHGRIPSFLSRWSLLGARYLSPWSGSDASCKRNWLESSKIGRAIRLSYWNTLGRQVQMTFPHIFPINYRCTWKDIMRSTSRIFPSPPGLNLKDEDETFLMIRGVVNELVTKGYDEKVILSITRENGSLQDVSLDTDKDMVIACTGYLPSSTSVASLFDDIREARKHGIPTSSKGDLDSDEVQWRQLVLKKIQDARRDDSLLTELFTEDDYSIGNLDTYKLYNHMVPIDQVEVSNKFRDFAVICLPQTLSAAIIASVQARWLSCYFQGEAMTLPSSTDEAGQKTAQLIAASLSRYGVRDAKQGTTMSLELSWYANLLLWDLKMTKGPCKDYFQPFRALCSDDFL